MNYYERHLGDYAKDAGHLTMLEHGAYTLLLDRYYTTEQGIAADQAHRLCRARSREEREAVDTVLAEFFTLIDGAWINPRAQREIAGYHEAAPDREAKKENDRERQRRARERRKELFDILRGHGVVPPYDAKTADLEAMIKRATSRTGHAPVTLPVTRDNTANQTPVTSNQSIPPLPPDGGTLVLDPSGKEPARPKGKPVTLKAWLDAIKAAGEKAVPDDDPVLAYAERVGIPHDMLALAWWKFRRSYLTDRQAKRYTDWRRVFRNAVEGNWLKLWYADAQGAYALTTVGIQAQRDRDGQQEAAA